MDEWLETDYPGSIFEVEEHILQIIIKRRGKDLIVHQLQVSA